MCAGVFPEPDEGTGMFLHIFVLTALNGGGQGEESVSLPMKIFYFRQRK